MYGHQYSLDSSIFTHSSILRISPLPMSFFSSSTYCSPYLFSSRVVESYNQTLTEMVESQAKQESGVSTKVTQLEQQLTTVRQEKAHVEIDLNKTEAAFSDLHRKYEKLKEVLGMMNTNFDDEWKNSRFFELLSERLHA